MSAEHFEPAVTEEPGSSEPAETGQEDPSLRSQGDQDIVETVGTRSAASEQDELTLEELERHIAEAEQVHQDLTARLDATARD